MNLLCFCTTMTFAAVQYLRCGLTSHLYRCRSTSVNLYVMVRLIVPNILLAFAWPWLPVHYLNCFRSLVMIVIPSRPSPCQCHPVVDLSNSFFFLCIISRFEYLLSTVLDAIIQVVNIDMYEIWKIILAPVQNPKVCHWGPKSILRMYHECIPFAVYHLAVPWSIQEAYLQCCGYDIVYYTHVHCTRHSWQELIVHAYICVWLSEHVASVKCRQFELQASWSLWFKFTTTW